VIAALLVLQLAAAAAVPAPIVVRDASHSVKVALVAGESGSGPLLNPQGLAPIVAVTVHRQSPVAYTLEIAGVRLELEPGLPSVRIGGDVRQLAAAPVVRGSRLLVPLQLVSEVLPDVAVNLRWDARARALIVFGNEKTRAASPGAPRGREAPKPVARVASRGAVAPAAPRPESGKLRRTVIVDAGHGGPDNGMTGPIGGGPRIYEKDITLAVAKKLGAALRERGADVVYTRTRDTLIALSDRGRIANRSGGDLFISVHVNAANPNWRDPGASRGFETYFLAEAKTEDARRVEQMENEAVRFENGPAVAPDDPLGFIISDMVQNEHLRESSELADIIQRRLARIHPGPNRGVKQAGFRVLVTAFMPSVLVEIGFGTNPAEAAYLADPRRQDAIARAIADAAVEYLQRYERRISGPSE
jgi:N-acetylmuramoyl-L-alanine amidase